MAKTTPARPGPCGRRATRKALVLRQPRLAMYSTENLDSGATQYNELMAYSNSYLDCYSHDHDGAYQTWILSLVPGSGIVESGSRLRLIKKGYGQYMIPSESRGKHYLSTAGDYSGACI